MTLFACLLIFGGCASEETPTTPTASIAAVDIGTERSTPNSTLAASASSPAETQTDADPIHPRVLISTSLGDIKIELDREKAPVTVNNFLSYADSGHYDGSIFHQVIDQFIVLGGGYDEQFAERPTSFPIRNEAENGVSNVRGTIAMARQPDIIASSTSQFFLNVADNTMLDHMSTDPAGFGYCVFGKVVEGMDVVDKIAQTAVTDRDDFKSTPLKSVVIHSVTRAR